MIELITFDAAGTLIDHSWDPAGIVLEAAGAAGLEVEPVAARETYESILSKTSNERAQLELRGDPAEIRAHWRRGVSEWLIKMGEDAQHSREIHEYAERATLSPNGSMWRLFPDVEAALELAAGAEVVLGVLSNWDRSLHVILNNLGIAKSFDFAIASLEFGHEKPDPEIFREAERRAGSSAGGSVHIGDDWADDVEGATGAGWRAIHLNRAGGPIHSLTAAVEEALR